MGKIKAFIENHIVDIVCITAFIFFVLGCWYLYTANRTKNDYNNVTQSVERTEAGIENAESGVGTAQTEIKHAEKHVQRANEAAGKLTERTKRNARTLDESEQLIKRMSERSSKIEGIVESVEAGNTGTRAQANSNT